MSTQPAGSLNETQPKRKRGGLGRFVSRNQRAVIGGVVLVLIFASAIFADWLAPYPPNRQNLRNRLQPPSAEHVLGTDNFGRDLWSRILFGYRSSIGIAVGAVAFAAILGTAVGLAAACTDGGPGSSDIAGEGRRGPNPGPLPTLPGGLELAAVERARQPVDRETQARQDLVIDNVVEEHSVRPTPPRWPRRSRVECSSTERRAPSPMWSR